MSADETPDRPKRAARGTGRRLYFTRGVLFSKLSEADWQAAMAACRLLGKDPRDVMAELVLAWLTGIRSKVQAEIRS